MSAPTLQTHPHSPKEEPLDLAELITALQQIYLRHGHHLLTNVMTVTVHRGGFGAERFRVDLEIR